MVRFLGERLKPAMRQKPFETGEYEEKGTENGENEPGTGGKKKDPWD